MKKCDWCGRENNEEVLYCRECGMEFPAPAQSQSPNLDFLVLFGIYPEGFIRRTPIFGFFSIISPLLGVALGWIVANHSGPGSGESQFRYVFYGIGVFLWSLIIGFGMAVIAWLRAERHNSMILLGALTNLGPLALVFVLLRLHHAQ